MKISLKIQQLFFGGADKQMHLKKLDFKSKIAKISLQVDGKQPAPKAMLPGMMTTTTTRRRTPKSKVIGNFAAKKVKSLRRATNMDLLSDGSFQEAVGPVLAMAQFFAIMPLRGVKSHCVDDLHFTWKSMRTLYTLVVFMLVCLNAALSIAFLYHDTIEFLRVVPVIFSLTTTYAMVSFYRLGKKWPMIMKQWAAVETHLPPLQSQFERAKLSQQIKMITICVMLLSLMEHLLNIITGVYNANKCKHTQDPIENVMLVQMPHIFFYTKYTPAKAVLGKVINVISTFVWTYMDVFVMIISVALVRRFRQVNESLMAHKGMAMPEKFWIDHRIYYRNICDLCVTIDTEIGHITLVSFSNNLWFICVQLLFSLNSQPSMAHAVYFWYSLVFLIGRTLAVSLYSADINDESKEPLKIIRSVPIESWCLEIKRFANEITRDVVALSGLRFFYLTRTLVLSIAGTIITYELVLVQFHTGEYNRGECDLEFVS